MALILNIESSTTMCSVALARDGVVIAQRAINDGYSHAEKLAPFVDEVLSEAAIDIKSLDAIAVSEGPGSYTGLRIGVSLAKGLCFGSGVPLISVPTLLSMCMHPDIQDMVKDRPEILLCPMLDARRMEVYCAVYDARLNVIRALEPVVLDQTSFSDLLAENRVVFFGNGSSKFEELLDNNNAVFIDQVWPMADNMASLSQQKFDLKEFADTAYFEPNYLKAFQATTPKKLL